MKSPRTKFWHIGIGMWGRVVSSGSHLNFLIDPLCQMASLLHGFCGGSKSGYAIVLYRGVAIPEGRAVVPSLALGQDQGETVESRCATATVERCLTAGRANESCDVNNQTKEVRRILDVGSHQVKRGSCRPSFERHHIHWVIETSAMVARPALAAGRSTLWQRNLFHWHYQARQYTRMIRIDIQKMVRVVKCTSRFDIQLKGSISGAECEPIWLRVNYEE